MVLNTITLLSDVGVCSMDNEAMNSFCGPNIAQMSNRCGALVSYLQWLVRRKT
jgi:hypothetical protein